MAKVDSASARVKSCHERSCPSNGCAQSGGCPLTNGAEGLEEGGTHCRRASSNLLRVACTWPIRCANGPHGDGQPSQPEPQGLHLLKVAHGQPRATLALRQVAAQSDEFSLEVDGGT
jgi:hypothetical protein